jgi:uncharacterized protein (DUF433 family)
MVAAPDNELLGIGLYTMAEAALYARVSPQKLSRWTFGNKAGAAVFRSQRGSTEQRFVSFLDFVQALSVRAVRSQFPEVPLSNIREAIENAQRDHLTPFPLALENHRIFVNGTRLVINIGQQEKDLVELNREHRGQRAFHQVVQVFVKNLDFDASGVANKYTPFISKNGRIVMDPAVRMGEPLVAECGYTAMALVEAVKNEGSIEEATRAYGVTAKNIRTAFEYLDTLQIAA